VTLNLGRHAYSDGALLIMAIVNRTPDSFYDRGATYGFDQAVDRVAEVVAQGADIVDIGGVKAAPGDEVDAVEEIRRTVDFVAAVRSAYPDLVISVDTWRHEVAREVCRGGADLLNDAWGGHDPRLAEVAAEFDAALVCTHAGGVAPRTRPHRISYPDVMVDIISRTVGLAERAAAIGVDRSRIMIDPGHDFGKNTWHSLEATRRLSEMVDTGWPVLVSLSNKDFIGETLDREQGRRLEGSLAAAVICIVKGARIVRMHDVPAAVAAVHLTEAVLGFREPAYARHNLE
jgi:dihydropteroate synthase